MLSVQPKITGLVPTSGSPGDSVEVDGTCFGNQQSPDPTVTVGGEDAKVLSWADDKISIEVPQDMRAGAQPVVVTSGGGNAVKSNAVNLSVQIKNTPTPATSSSNSNSAAVSLNLDFSSPLADVNKPDVIHASATLTAQATGAGVTVSRFGVAGISIKYDKSAPFHLVLSGQGTVDRKSVHVTFGTDPSAVGYTDSVYTYRIVFDFGPNVFGVPPTSRTDQSATIDFTPAKPGGGSANVYVKVFADVVETVNGSTSTRTDTVRQELLTTISLSYGN